MVDARSGGSLLIGGEIEVPRLGYGCMRLTGEGIWGDPADRSAAIALLQRSYELGVRLYDTAAAYGPETNELLVHDALAPYRDALIATKCGTERQGPGKWSQNGRPEAIRSGVEGSLKRLGVETIDLMQLHAPDRAVPIEESVGELAAMRNEGKIRHIGVSNVSVEQLRAAQAVAPIVSVQNRYNVGHREHEDVVEACETQGVAFLAYFPIDGGALAKPGGAVESVAHRHGATSSQVCLSWLLQCSPVIAPIPGTSSVAHLEENLAAASVHLDAEDLSELAPS
jgi:pyridoxine 4-dehydrogenase